LGVPAAARRLEQRRATGCMGVVYRVDSTKSRGSRPDVGVSLKAEYASQKPWIRVEVGHWLTVVGVEWGDEAWSNEGR
jgi:hypothetical protein